MSLTKLNGQQVDVVISGDTFFKGRLLEAGKDILVLFDGQKYVYIPLLHVHRIQLSSKSDDEFMFPNEMSLANKEESISYRKILLNAKGLFTEIYVTGNVSIHGYIINVRSDYLAFYSPVYKTMLISLNHLKWLIPYNLKNPPYTLGKEKFSVIPSNISLISSFEDQIKKWEGELVVFDMADKPMKIGLVKNVSESMIELINANGGSIYYKLSHIKSVHLP